MLIGKDYATTCLIDVEPFIHVLQEQLGSEEVPRREPAGE
jgi:hypothetical protein